MILCSGSYNIFDSRSGKMLIANAPELGNNYVGFTQAAVDSVMTGFGGTFVSIALVFFVSFFPFVHENIVLCNVLCCALITIMLFAFIMYVIHFREAIKRTADEVFHRKNETLPDGEAEEIK